MSSSCQTFFCHCTHRLQPLDVSVFCSLNSNYNEEIRSFLRKRDRCVTENNFPELFTNAYCKTANVQIAMNGFMKTDIHPFNRDAFIAEGFMSADATNRELLVPVATPASLHLHH